MIGALVRYEEMRVAVERCARIDEAAEIKDKAAALQAYARQRDDAELEVWTSEIKLRASVRIGELVRELDKAQGARTELLPATETKSTAIAEAGLSKSQAYRYQELAGPREANLQTAGKAAAERYFAEARATKVPATESGLRSAVTVAVHAAMGPDALKRAASAIKREEKQAGQAQRAAKVEELAATVPAIAERYELHHAACIAALELPQACADLIVSDPPYPAEYLPVYDDLACVAAHVLKPGGLAVVMVGQTYLPDIIASLSKHLTYHWMLAYLTPGGQAVQQFQRHVNAFWKPVLVFSHGAYDGAWFADVAKSDTNDNDKDHHHWGQSASGMRDLMRRFVKPGNMVLDPFLGGGTTGVVALELGARFIGFDIDEAAITTTKARIGGISASLVA